MELSPHPFTLRQLQYALAVADTLGFRRAAEACHVSQPALSAQIAQLEDQLGAVLFERDGRRVLLTPAGELLLPRLRRLVVDAHALAEAARRAADPLASTLRVGVIPTIAPYLLPRLTPRLRDRFPRLSLQWTEEKTPVLVSRLATGAMDAVLLAQEAELGEVEHALVCHDPFVLAMPLGHPLAEGGPLPFAALVGESLMLLDEGHCLRAQVLAHCHRTGVDETAFRATSLGTLAQMVAAGAGLTLLPALAVPAETLRAPLAIRPLVQPGPARTLVLAWRAGSPLGTALSTLAAAMREGAATRGIAVAGGW